MKNEVGRPALASERQALIGARLKQAALEAGYPTTTALAEALGVSDGTVSRWWTGRRAIGVDLLERYAALVGKRPAWFQQRAGEEFTEIGEQVASIFGQWLYGRPLLEAVDQVTGGRAPLGPRERALLAEVDQQFKVWRRSHGAS